VAILRATANLLASRGYEHLSMEGIAAEAGVGKQTIYRWWPSKSALVAESMLDADLEAWVRSIFAFTEAPENDLLMRSLVSAASDNRDVGRRLHERLGAGSELSARLAAAVASGQVRSDLPVRDVGEVLVGAVVLRILTREPSDAGLAARLVDIVLGGRTRR
jgi:AcrR family transcriptional regulator